MFASSSVMGDAGRQEIDEVALHVVDEQRGPAGVRPPAAGRR